jgi:two-component system NtrC family sensor kinase
VLETVLTDVGYQVDSAANGQQALQSIESCRYDLIISDMCMPEVDGEQLYETIRAKDPRLARRILFLTGDTVNNKSRSFLERTGNRWLSKPFNIRNLEQTVGNALRQQLVTIRTETGQRVD